MCIRDSFTLFTDLSENVGSKPTVVEKAEAQRDKVLELSLIHISTLSPPPSRASRACAVPRRSPASAARAWTRSWVKEGVHNG